MSIKFASQRKIFQIHAQLVKTQNPRTLNPLLRSLTDSNEPKNALLMYNQMLAHNHCHNHYTFTHALKACTKSLHHLRKGLEIHAHVTKLGHVSDIFIRNTLLHFYVTHIDVVSASKAFDSIPRPNVVSWSLIVSGLSKCGFEEEAIVRFSSMDVEPNSFTLASLVSACSGLKALNFGKAVHGYTFRNGLENHSIVLDNAVLDFYTKCGSLENARHVFDEMPDRDVFSWTALIGGCARRGLCEEATELFRRMIEEGNTEPNEVTLINLLSACSSVGALNLGRWIYSYIVGRKTDAGSSSVNVRNALVNMFVKCGDLGEAVRVFDELEGKDVIAWSSMINGMAMNGLGSRASELFARMVVHGVTPDEGTFVGLLSACSHAGLVDRGLRFFYSMRRVYGIEPRDRHYAIMADMFGRAGMLRAAEDFISEMPIQPDSAIWGALVNACKIHGDAEMIERVGRRTCVAYGGGGCRGVSGGSFALLSNAYAGCGRWSESDEIRREITRLGLKKVAGCSWIEANTEI